MAKVSIITPTYNRAGLIGDAIKSVLKQSYKDWELIIIDDGSTDKTEEAVHPYLTDPQITYIKNESNLGISKNRNKGISLSKGVYIAMIDSDDVWLDSEKLSKQVNFLDNNREFGIVGTQITGIDKDGKILKLFPAYEVEDKKIRQKILLRNQFAQSSILIRRSILDKTGMYNESYRVWEDFDLWTRIGQISKFANLKDYSTGYRIHDGSISNEQKVKSAKFLLSLIRKNKGNYPNYFLATLKCYLRIFLAFLHL
ncbi:MAG: glycosyltransferase family 2 protein [Candidatus Taylorbacteria bacterium]|nr:glycosyltransferase family 2 protein [Candidatus Taylorbacteria bacterium]